MTVIKRPAISGSFTESVDLKADYEMAFGSRFEALVGVAISADSDDTNGFITAKINALDVD